MSRRKKPQPYEAVSPYLLRPCRTYEEYLRDAEAARQDAAEEERRQAVAYYEPGYEAD